MRIAPPRAFLVAAVTLLGSSSLMAADDDPNGVYIRVVDAGPGLCTVTRMPGNHFMVYDAGHWDFDAVCLRAVQEIVPSGEPIDLLVLSHSDSDHLAAVDEIFDHFTVDRVIRSGNTRWLIKTWRQAYWAIRRARNSGDTVDVNLWRLPGRQIQPGFTMAYGDTTLTQVSGWNLPPDSWDMHGRSEKNNAGSIVIRLEFAGKSVLFTGDAIGRHLRDPADTCIAAEASMVGNVGTVPLQSEVLIAPHHGADNGSSTCFIEAVDPDWVIFSAGHDHHHPRQAVADRYLAHGLTTERLLRTDLGDNEGQSEWSLGATSERDRPEDEDVEIKIGADGTVAVRYRE
jgi:competence protein ComEC